MDLLSLLAWRGSCIVNYAHATAALKRTLTSMINPFLSHPAAILDIISRYSAVIGGEVALAFVRRPHPIQPRTLEIFASTSLYRLLCDDFMSDPRLSPDIVSTISVTTHFPYNIQSDVLETMQIVLRSSRTIYIRRSSTLSPLSPIARSICTAMVNFVTPHCFGCAYPRLTLDDKALISDSREDSMADFDATIMRTLAMQQIDVAVDPATWQQYRIWSPSPANTDTAKACWRSHYICPEQGRFFGDRGSLVDFIDPLGTPPAALQKQGSPPFGTSVIWRLSSSYRCPLSCQSHDNILLIGQTSTAIILLDDPYANPGRERQRGRTISRSNGNTRSMSYGLRIRSLSL